MNIKYLLASLTTLAASSGAQVQPLQNPPCNICGSPTYQDSSVEITNPDAILHIPDVEESKTCAEWAIDGQNGRIPQQVCEMLPAVTVYVCDCQEVVVDSFYPSPSPPSSSCLFCFDGITIHYSTTADDAIDGFDETLCQRLVEGAQLLSASSLYCEKLRVGEQLCCPSNNNGGDMVMSLDYSYLYHVGRSKASKTKTRKAKHHDFRSKAGKKL